MKKSLKRILKVFLITLGTLLILVLIALGILSWYIFTPEKLTPVVRNQVEKIVTCEAEIGSVELTLFSTFPRLGFQVNGLTIINPIEGTQSDTLLHMDRFRGFFDIKAFWSQKDLIFSEIILENGIINVFFDEGGDSNLDIFALQSEADPDSESSFTINKIDVGTILLKNANISYLDKKSRIHTGSRNLEATLAAVIHQDVINSNLQIDRGIVYFEQNDEVFIPESEIKLRLPGEINLSRKIFHFPEAFLSLEGMAFNLNGFVENDTKNDEFLMDINYKTLAPLHISEVMSFIPPSMERFVEGMEAEGLVSSTGNLSGFPKGSFMPVLDIQLKVEEGVFTYTYLPLPLHNIHGDFGLYTDLLTDGTSVLQIHNARANSPKSSIRSQGKLDHLFSDVHFDLNTHARLSVDEFQAFLPETMDASLGGRVQGNIRSDFTLSQAMDLSIEEMKLSGKLSAQDLDIAYEALWLKADRSEIEFALPNPFALFHDASFVFADIHFDSFEASDPALEHVMLSNAHFMLEASDLRNGVDIPDIICNFSLDHLMVEMDTMMLDISHPTGSITLSPIPGKPGHPEVLLSYNSDRIHGKIGNELITMNRTLLNAEVINDKSKEDFFLQWLVTGFLELEDGLIQTSFLNHPIEIPSIEVDFEPERLSIDESRIILDNSDFELRGQLNNLLSYVRGDTILHGRFDFTSNTTDVIQLMMLTSGLGLEEDEQDLENQVDLAKTDNEESHYIDDDLVDNETEPDTFSGPYMVPEGVDILLTTNIKQALLGADTARRIVGDVRISDGILLLDDLSFIASSARMQMTAMYRTPRKNHLFLGLDYHMMDIEIERLLQMIPEIVTIMPMLSSFKGQGAFHMAIESYLDSTYTLKMSTLRGAASITGQDLVLMDGETFSEIANTLWFSRRAENMVDSLSAEFTIFRREIDVYPFLIIMDRYSAVVGGRHNLDMSFNYHISLVQSPLPFRLGIDVIGTMEDMNFSLASPRYAELYRPASRGLVQNRQIELRQLIRDALLERLGE